MIARLILFVLSVVFGILTYTHSDKVIAKQFVVTEKVKTDDHLYLKYKKNNVEAIFEATPEQYIDATEKKTFVVLENQTAFWVYAVLCGACVIIFLLSIGVNGFELLEVLG